MADSIQTRDATPDDLITLAEYWYDRMVMVQQYNARVRLLPKAQQRWQATASTWLGRDDAVFRVAQTAADTSELLGAVAGVITDNAAGLAPARICQVVAFVVDMHTPRLQAGVGRVLLRSLSEALALRDIQRIVITVYPALSVEAAFWQSVGARRVSGNYWLSANTD
jgi:hypothetical protein